MEISAEVSARVKDLKPDTSPRRRRASTFSWSPRLKREERPGVCAVPIKSLVCLNLQAWVHAAPDAIRAPTRRAGAPAEVLC